MAKRTTAKKNIVPFKTLLDRARGRIAARSFSQEKVKPLTEPVSMDFWFPGEPRSKGQGFPTINWKMKPPRAYIAPDKTNQEHEDLIRERFLDQIEEKYPEVLPYLPLIEGVIGIRGYFLMTPPQDWWPDKQHTHSPDDENLIKIVSDALAGRQKKRGSYLHHDDTIKTGSLVLKEYWNPKEGMNPNNHYPMEPGAFIAVTLLPMVRNPDWLPREEGTCPHCGRHDFKARWALKKHAKSCKG